MMTNFGGEFFEIENAYPTLMKAMRLIPNLKEDVLRFAQDAVTEERTACLEIYKEGFDKNWVAQDVIDVIERQGEQ